MSTQQPADKVAEFIARWAASAGAERANYQLFLTQLCDLLDVPQPEPTKAEDNAYVFERDVTFTHGDGSTSPGRIDLYRRGAFVLEAKQGSDAETAAEEAAAALADAAKKKPAKKKGTAVRGTKAWDDAMVRARGQADRYARALPTGEGWPPFLIVVDVGHVIELYSEFSRSGKTYVPFPDPQSFRIPLTGLADPALRERLKAVWLDPLSLDPSRRAAKVTRALSERLAALAKLLEAAGHDPALVARFLMRALFTMFAEDVELIPRGSFRDLLASLRDDPGSFVPMVEGLWQAMNGGHFSQYLRRKLLRFNGGLFAEWTALPVDKPMLELLIDAAACDWTNVEPAIFGTLLERALSPIDRHKLGAHYTPRAYVERLVLPTVIEPLREEWTTTYAAALAHARGGQLDKAQELVRDFHHQLCETRVLDPACGSGNFLYVTLEHMKRLEGEVLNALKELGDQQAVLIEVDPHQFLGIEISPRAAAIAELVLWIGHLQWHFRTRGHAALAEPIIKNYRNIECRDAVLAWDRTEPLLDANNKPVTRWDGRTMKLHPVTGEEVPDETAKVLVQKYINPRKAEWPKADYVVGNPPFIGFARMRDYLGDGYTEAIRKAYPDVPESCDYVLYWWFVAAGITTSGGCRRFGFITTNSIRQTFSRRVLAQFLEGSPRLTIAFAIPDHPWVDSTDGADVRISMTVGSTKEVLGKLWEVVGEEAGGFGEICVQMSLQEGWIHADLTTGANVTALAELKANDRIGNRGVQLIGKGFVISKEETTGLGYEGSDLVQSVVRKYRNGRDITDRPRDVLVIDLFGWSIADVRERLPSIYQWVVERVKPERDQNARASYREKWWIFGEPVKTTREALRGLRRYIVTCRTAKHRTFIFLDGDVVPDAKLITVALDDALYLGVLSSRPHVVFATRIGGWLGVGNDSNYNHSECFAKFPFPAPGEHGSRIRTLAEELDAHRKRQQALHPKLTLTDMYNVLEKLRAGEPLSAKDKTIHDSGLVSVLRQIHDDLDAAVFDAYGWPHTLTDDEILERLVALNAERAAEEARGIVRWLRPEFQQGDGKRQRGLALEEEGGVERGAEPLTPGPSPAAGRGGKGRDARRGEGRQKERAAAAGRGSKKADWPPEQSERTKLVQEALSRCTDPVTAADLAKGFLRARAATVEEILDALCALGLARKSRGKYLPP